MNQQHAHTVAAVISDELRGIHWAQQAIARVMEDIHMAARDVPNTDEYAELRREIARLQLRLREAHGRIAAAEEAGGSAKLSAIDATPVYITDDRLIARRDMHRHGADKIARARKEREEREATFAARQRHQRELERQAWIAARKREREERLKQEEADRKLREEAERKRREEGDETA